MRSRLGGGIVDFYRQQSAAIATGEIRPRGSRGPQAPSPANRNVSPDESALARDIIEAVAQGSQIHCNARQYPEIRAALSRAVKIPENFQDEIQTLLISKEIERLDLLFGSEGHPNVIV
jgi:hypothetical protein